MAKLKTKRPAAPAPIAIQPAGAGPGVPAPEVKRPRYAYILPKPAPPIQPPPPAPPPESLFDLPDDVLERIFSELSRGSGALRLSRTCRRGFAFARLALPVARIRDPEGADLALRALEGGRVGGFDAVFVDAGAIRNRPCANATVRFLRALRASGRPAPRVVALGSGDARAIALEGFARAFAQLPVVESIELYLPDRWIAPEASAVIGGARTIGLSGALDGARSVLAQSSAQLASLVFSGPLCGQPEVLDAIPAGHRGVRSLSLLQPTSGEGSGVDATELLLAAAGRFRSLERVAVRGGSLSWAGVDCLARTLGRLSVLTIFATSIDRRAGADGPLPPGAFPSIRELRVLPRGAAPSIDGTVAHLFNAMRRLLGGAGAGAPRRVLEIDLSRSGCNLGTCTNLMRAAANGPIRVLLPATARISSA